MVAMLPLSKYLNGGGTGPPVVRALISLPTYLPSCMAGWATPGSLFSETMSPIANTSGCPGRLQSGLTETRPARSVSAPVFSASILASGEACTPGRPDPGAGADRLDPVRALDRDGLVVHVDGQGVEPISTPIFSRCSLVYFCSFGLNGGSTAGAPSSMMIRASVVSTVRYSCGSTLCASSASWPASSTPVGPGADHHERQPLGPFLAGRWPAPPSRTWTGCRRAGSGRPRWSSCPARTRRTRPCRSTSATRRRPPPACRRAGRRRRPSGPSACTTLFSRSRSLTSASSARALRCFLMVPRMAGAIRPGEHDARRDLVQQRLEQVVVRPIDDGDVHVRSLRARGRRSARRTRRRRSPLGVGPPNDGGPSVDVVDP